MRGTGHTWLQQAVAATAWLLALCAAGACTGPGLEPPAAANRGDAGNAGTGGTAAGGGTGGGGEPSVDPGDASGGDGDSTSDAGEALPDGGVDDGGADPDELEP